MCIRDRLTPTTTVLDLGAGTGQLALMAAPFVASVLSVDPEPDMVSVGHKATSEFPNVRWELGADSDVVELVDEPIDLVLIGNAFHHMDRAALLVDLDQVVAQSGAVVVCSTSKPVWLQDTAWSVALRHQLSEELGREVGAEGTPRHSSDAVLLGASEFSEVDRWESHVDGHRSIESIVGEVVSSASGALDEAAIARISASLEPYSSDWVVDEQVESVALVARRPNR